MSQLIDLCEIIDQKGDYVLGLKGNQGNLYEDVKLAPFGRIF